MSLGSSSPSSTVRDTCVYAYYGYSGHSDTGHDNPGVILVGTPGNSGPCSDGVGYLNAFGTTIAVSAIDKNDDLADFSSTGPEVELAAPGIDVLSTAPGGYDQFDGTSMAAPRGSGAGAILMTNGYLNEEARRRLRETAVDIGFTSNKQESEVQNVATLAGSV